jgi:hypothetical protein
LVIGHSVFYFCVFSSQGNGYWIVLVGFWIFKMGEGWGKKNNELQPEKVSTLNQDVTWPYQPPDILTRALIGRELPFQG